LDYKVQTVFFFKITAISNQYLLST